MTKKDLKVGMVCEIDYHGETSLCMILPSKSTHKCISGEKTWFPLERLTDDLIYGERRVNKVYDICEYNSSAYKLSTEDRKLLWERPKYYNGKVVCIKANNSFLTKGKIYEFENGYSVDDCGNSFPCVTQIESLEHLNETMYSEFIELVE